MRGDQQDIDMPIEFVDSLFKKVNYASSLIITGGEPSLVPDIIVKIIRLAQKHQVKIGNFWLVTNGKVVSDRFLQSVVRLYGYCSDHEVTGLALSTDQWHEPCPPQNRRMLQAFKFYTEHGPRSVDNLITEGRGASCGASRDKRTGHIEIDDNQVEDLYLNCKGNIINGCDWSYESQEDEDKIICSVHDLSVEAIHEYTQRLEGKVYEFIKGGV